MKKMTCTIALLVFFCFSLIGQCIQGDCQNGEGAIKYKSGNKYLGTFKNGKKHGYGKFIWVSGAKYKGGWVENKREGVGEEFLADGTKFIGKFKNHKKHGEGKLYAANGSLIKRGIWYNGAFRNNNEKSKKSNESNENSNSQLLTRPSPNKNPFDRYINLGIGFASQYANNLSSTIKLLVFSILYII